jgi:hypothetical protein
MRRGATPTPAWPTIRLVGSMKRAGAFGICIVAAMLTGTAAASAQTPPVTRPRPATVATTQPRTTVPTTDPKASTFPVLQTGDLPSGYRMGTGSPFHIENRSAIYPSVDDCVWDFDNPFSGLTPDIYQSSFQKSASIRGLSITIEFDAPKPATAYYDNFDEAYRAAAKCKTTKAPSSSSSSGVSDYGTVKLVDVGSLGDESFGAVITPSSTLFPEAKFAVWRDGDAVVTLRVDDPDMTLKQFTALTKTAAKRAS